MQQLIKRKKSIFLLVLVIVLQIIVHAPHVGKGFIKDDFIWLENVVTNGEIDYLRPFSVTTGFYRPIVSLSFAAQYKFFKLNSKPYGLFNLLLHLLNIVLVYQIFSCSQHYKSYAPLVAVLFAFNAKGTAFAVGWISARTTLLFTLFMLLTIWLILKLSLLDRKQGWTTKTIARYIFTGLVYLAALLSKENAVIAPFFFFLYIYFFNKSQSLGFLSWERVRNALLSVLVFILPLMIYFFLRLGSNAFSPMNAPDYYQYSFSPGLLLKNLLEYIIRAGLFDLYIITCLVFVILVSRKRSKSQTFDKYKIMLAGILWFLCFLLPTLPIASRSDLYVYFPQIGMHLALTVIIVHLWRKIEYPLQKRKIQFLMILPVLLLVLAWLSYLVIRSSAYGKEGSFSHRFSHQVAPLVSMVEPVSQIFIMDMEKDKKYSPAGIISYGFDAFLKLYHRDKRLKGKILTYGGITEINWADAKTYLCFWHKNKLMGPYDCSLLRSCVFLLNPYTTGFLEKPKKQTQTPRKRLYRLKTRRIRLKKNAP